MEYWYNEDVVNINKYCHIIMLKLGEKDLNKLIKLLYDENKKQIEYFREELIKMNSKFKFRRPFSKEKMDDIVRKVDRAEALKEGKTAGIIENKIANAKNMLKKGIDIMTIAECTELSCDKVLEIKSTM